MKKPLKLYIVLIASVFVFTVSSCREKTAVEKVEDSVEEVGEDIEEAGEEIKDEIDDATNDSN